MTHNVKSKSMSVGGGRGKKQQPRRRVLTRRSEKLMASKGIVQCFQTKSAMEWNGWFLLSWTELDDDPNTVY